MHDNSYLYLAYLTCAAEVNGVDLVLDGWAFKVGSRYGKCERWTEEL